MKTFRIQVSREWTEPGEVTLQAEDEESAREIVTEMLSNDTSEIQWNGSNMEPGKDEIESVSEVSNPE